MRDVDVQLLQDLRFVGGGDAGSGSAGAGRTAGTTGADAGDQPGGEPGRSGEIPSCNYNRDYQTAKVVNSTIATASAPVTVFTLWDNAYPDGTAAQFRNCYDITWGEPPRAANGHIAHLV